jgi:hypothetical protein
VAVAVAAARRGGLLLPPLLLRDLELALVVAAVVEALEVVVGPRLARGWVLAVVLDALFCLGFGVGRGWRERPTGAPLSRARARRRRRWQWIRDHAREDAVTAVRTFKKSMKKW